jgi:predicted lipoprotein with Yx(FWY)xxD motif
MKRISILFTCIAVLAAATATAAVAAGHRAKLKLGNTSIGKIVENGGGFTVYMFTRDGRGKDRCIKVGGCTSIWPPVTSSTKALAGPGIKRGLIGSIRLPSGAKQVTYAGHPLYTYSADPGPGSTFYVGVPQFGGRWLALDAAGRAHGA